MAVEDLLKGSKDGMKNMSEMLYRSALESINDKIYVLYIDPQVVTIEEVAKYNEKIIDSIKPNSLIILPNTSYLSVASKEEIESWIAYAQSRLKTI